MMKEHDLGVLPFWTQKLIIDLRGEIKSLEKTNELLEKYNFIQSGANEYDALFIGRKK